MSTTHARGQAAVALGALRQVINAVESGKPADNTLAELSRENRKWGSRDRRFISSLVYSYFRWRGWLPELDVALAAALAYSLDATEPHNAVLSLADRDLPAWGNLPIADKMEALASLTNRELSIEMLVPSWLPAMVPDAECHRLICSFQQRPPTWLRARRGSADQIVSALRNMGVTPRLDGRIPNAIACEGGANFVELRKEVGSRFEAQDIASQAVGVACDPSPGQRWWDVCAGAGGKSLHLADLMEDRGEVIASDIRGAALDELRRRAAASGVRSIKTLIARRDPEGLFDGVLVDAPCSGIGTWSRNPDMRWRTSEAVVTDKAEIQIELMLRAADYVKTGGKLVFAVCTITRAETTAIVEMFRRARPAFEVVSSRCWWPLEGPGDGMYIASFRRTA